MFVRFRRRNSRLLASVIETRRINGRMRHETIASLGSIEMPPSVPDRIAFWARLHERFAKLENRVSSAMQGKLLGEVHARIPMVTADEQRALQLENAEADAQFWSGIHDMHAGTVEGHKQLVATAQRAITKGETSMADVAAKAATAKDRIERIKRGENVEGGLGKPPTQEDFVRIMRDAGLTDADIRYCEQLHEVWTAVGDETFHETVFKEMMDAKERVERNIVRSWHARLQEE